MLTYILVQDLFPGKTVYSKCALIYSKCVSFILLTIFEINYKTKYFVLRFFSCLSHRLCDWKAHYAAHCAGHCPLRCESQHYSRLFTPPHIQSLIKIWPMASENAYGFLLILLMKCQFCCNELPTEGQKLRRFY